MLSTLHNTVNTGSLVYLSDEFVEKMEDRYPERAFWHGEFRCNVIPEPEVGDKVSAYKVEFTEHPEGKTRRGFAVYLTPDNKMFHKDGRDYDPDMTVIGRKIA